LSKTSENSTATDLPVASPTKHPSYTTFTEALAKEALIEARCDIFIASQLLGVTAIRLDRAIRVSPLLRQTVETVKELGSGVSDQVIQSAIDARMSLYRVAGLDALHDLATMPIDENSAQNQVKLAAAARLAGGLEGGVFGGEMGEALRELNQLYQTNAPRLRVIREKTTVEIEPLDERVVSDQGKPE